MKKLLCLLLSAGMMLAFAGCAESDVKSDGESVPNSSQSVQAPTESEKDDAETVYAAITPTKEGVAEFAEKLRETLDMDSIAGTPINEENVYNVTPPEVAEQTDFKIFKHSDSCASFVMTKDGVYELGNSFGGYGVISAVPCDPDGDGNKDLLVASSWGSGIHRSEISVFNSVTREFEVIFSTMDTVPRTVDLAFSSSYKDEERGTVYKVCSVTVDRETVDRMYVNYTVGELFGTVEIVDGKATFKTVS